MFRFKIQNVHYLPVPKIWCLTGKLLSGNLKNGSTIYVDGNKQKLKIDTVAFVDPPNFTDKTMLTLTVKENINNAEDLKGKIISAVKVEKEELQTV